MANLTQVRRRLVWVIAAMAVLDAIAAIILLSPLVASPQARQEEEKSVHANVQQKLREVIPPDQVQTRIAEARKQIAAFYEGRLPSEYSAISAELGKLATENGVNLSQAKYTPADSGIRELRRVSVEATLVGNYLHEVKFINALERDRLFFLVNSVTLGEQTGGNVRLQLKLETYLKGQS